MRIWLSIFAIILLAGPAGTLAAGEAPVFRGAAWGQSPEELEAAEASRPDSNFLEKKGSIQFNYQGFPVELFKGWQFYSYEINFADLAPGGVLYAFPAETGDLQWAALVIPLPCPAQPDDLACARLVREEFNRACGPSKGEDERGGYRRVFWENPRLSAFGVFPADREREEDIRSLVVILASPREAAKFQEKLHDFLMEMARIIGESIGRAIAEAQAKGRPRPAHDPSTSRPPRNPKP